MRSATSSTPGKPGPHGPRKRNAAVVVSTLFGAGYLPGAPGTLGAALGIPVAVVLRLADLHVAIEGGILLVLVAGAVLVTTRAEKAFGRPDPPQIILDEFVSIPVTLFLVPLAWYWYALGFGLNRLLDVLKPPPIRQLQRLRGGWGIVADDLAAAIVANLVLNALKWLYT